MKHEDFTWDDIILEAPGDDVGDELSATDYAASDDMSIEEGEPIADEPADTEMEEDSATEDPAEEDPMEEDPADEDPLEDDPTETDPLEDDPADEDPLSDDTGESAEDEQTDNTESDVTTDKQNINLVNDYIELYYRIDEIMNQIRTDCKTNIRYNPNMQVVRKNLTKLKELTYDYIINKFTKETYVANLYQFNLIIQALNVNIELLGSVLASNKKFKEDKKKRPNNKKK